MLNEDQLRRDLEIAIGFFKDVKVEWETKRSLRWNLGVDTLKAALASLAAQETQEFLDNFLFIMINLLTSQNPKNLATHEKGCVYDCLQSAVHIVLQTLPTSPKYINVLVKVFDHSNIYYAGGKINFVHHPGLGAVRIEMIRKFTENGGFRILLEIFRNPRTVWFGVDNVSILLRAMRDGGNFIEEDIRECMITEVMKKLITMPEDQAKKENPDNITFLVKTIASIFQLNPSLNRKLGVFHQFWLDFTLKSLGSGSLVLRLFGWDQMHELIREGNAKRPLAESYIVSGAGNDDANGIYEYRKTDDDGAITYVKKPTRPNMPLLTLFRCSMKNTSKWWFISEQDKEKPCTDRDIDFYQHKSQVGEDREPPPRGWTTVLARTSPGREPPPILQRVGQRFPEGSTPEMYLLHQIPIWAAKNDILGLVFRSPHREVINRSTRLIILLAEEGALRADDVQMIWRAAMQSHDTDIVDEIFTLLVSASVSLGDDLYEALVNMAVEALAPEVSPVARQNSQNENFTKIAGFIEKIARESFREVVGCLSERSSSKLLSLIWLLYKNPSFESLKCSVMIQELLGKCLSLASGKQIVQQNIRECLVELAILKDLSPENPTAATAVEVQAAKVVHTLRFLISKNISVEGIRALETEGIALCVIGELDRFVKSNREKFEVGEGKKWYIGEVSSRLQALRQFYGLTSDINMPIAMVDSLWITLREQPCEMDCLFQMLHEGSLSESAIGNMAFFTQIFKNYICHPDVDWSLVGDASYECFDRYFKGLARQSWRDIAASSTPTELPPELGLDTLWTIAFQSNSSNAQNESVELLLKTYQDISVDSTDGHVQIIDRVFTRLTTLTGADGTPRSVSQDAKRVGINRCVDILYACIAKSRNSLLPPHAMNGRMARLKLTVHFRRLMSYYNFTTQSHNYRNDKGGEQTFTIEVHPMHSILQLKELIAQRSGASTSKVVLDGILKTASYVNRLSDFGLTEGSELSAYTQVNTYMNKGYDLENEYERIDYDSLLPSMGQAIAESKTYFDLLMSLLDQIEDESSAKRVWNLLMLMPTQPELVGKIAAHNFVSWGSIICDATLPKSTYCIQIIDHLLVPAPQIGEGAQDLGVGFKLNFLESGGFAAVLEFFVQTPASGGEVCETALAVALHILHFMLFENNFVEEEGEESKLSLAAHPELLEAVQANSAVVIEKLLSVASHAASSQHSGVVSDALQTLVFLLHSPDAVAQFISNPASRPLLDTVLRSGSSNVREMASDFAVQVGKTQPIVFTWLFENLKTLRDNDKVCADTFRALRALMNELHHSNSDAIDWGDLASTILSKIHSYSDSHPPPSQHENGVLIGYLEVLETLISLNPDTLTLTEMGVVGLSHTLIADYLFTLPSEAHDHSPICESSTSAKKAVFGVLFALIRVSREVFVSTLEEVSKLSVAAGDNFRRRWGMQISFDIKRPDISFSGLKNQGCTCYMNSTLQTLFMNSSFREAILRTPLLEHHRSTVHHLSNEELIGRELLFEFVNGSFQKGRVVNFDPSTGEHEVQYTDSVARFKLKNGQLGREKEGGYRLAPFSAEDPLTEREDAAQKVLEQLQRTFCFMKYSKRRFFDPKPFVEACKTLNMNFNVYHQNDASEFCDQLLDRIELATKGKYTHKRVWSDVFQRSIFGGKFLYQKIPQECEAYSTDKQQCGHWQSSRQESFLKIELIIRGKDNIHDSLADLVAGELMDGENKINCDVCAQKKDTVRRTCLEILPNMLILHLKRFDLDFNTFETVKLNNRMAFDTKLNLFKYTKEGMEVEERKKVAAADAGGDGSKEQEQLAYELSQGFVEPNIDDFEYELQGVLVHAGVAQGGHYYSFVRDSETIDKWYRFDDEDVSPFQSDQIPNQCFGGPANVSGTFEEDRTSNALMLFFNKVTSSDIPPNIPAQTETSPSMEASGAVVRVEENTKTADADVDTDDAVPKISRLVDGYEAFHREVQEWNLVHLLSRYMLDSELHGFVRDILAAIVASRHSEAQISSSEGDAVKPFQWLNAELISDVALKAVQFGSNFLFDIILHCRERVAMRAWVNVLKTAFETFPHTARWFIGELVNGQTTWLRDFLLSCTDVLARGIFVQVVIQALGVALPKDEGSSNILRPYLEQPLEVTQAACLSTTSSVPDHNVVGSLVVIILHRIVDFIFEVPQYARQADELFSLIREMAAFPCICSVMLDNMFVSKLVYFVVPDAVSMEIKQQFMDRFRGNPRTGQKQDFGSVYPSIFEALSALLGVPQIRRINLLQDRVTNWEYDLVPEAKDALTTIFNEVSPRGGMDANDVMEYREKTGIKITLQAAKLTIDRFSSTDGRLNLEGFLQYYTDTASYNPKDVWRDLTIFGFRNDLTRSSAAGVNTSGDIMAPSRLPLPEACRTSLANITFYQHGLQWSEACAKAIAKRMCAFDQVFSCDLIKQAMSRFLQAAPDHTWGNELIILMEFVRLLLGVDDGLLQVRMKEILLNPQCGLAKFIVREQSRPSNCRANDYDNRALFTKYINFVQDLMVVSGGRASLTQLAVQDQSVAIVKGHLRCQSSNLTENQDNIVRNTIVTVEGAGVPDVNGEYSFAYVMHNAGGFVKNALFDGKPTVFNLYKCNVQGGYQWFISIPPTGTRPGSRDDVDFYYASTDQYSFLPPQWWESSAPHGYRVNVKPAPRVTCITRNVSSDAVQPTPQLTISTVRDQQNSESGDHQMAGYESDDHDNSSMVADDDAEDGYDDAQSPGSRDHSYNL